MAVKQMKDFYRLVRNLKSFTNGQVEIVDQEIKEISKSVNYQDECTESLFVETVFDVTISITPNDGPYKGGRFQFLIRVNPAKLDETPIVVCTTRLYHPNIDTSYTPDPTEDGGNVCVSLFDEWDSNFGLEDCVQGLLFLFYEPNLDDPLSPYIPWDINEPFEETVQRSIRGEMDEFDYCLVEVNEKLDRINQCSGDFGKHRTMGLQTDISGKCNVVKCKIVENEEETRNKMEALNIARKVGKGNSESNSQCCYENAHTQNSHMEFTEVPEVLAKASHTEKQDVGTQTEEIIKVSMATQTQDIAFEIYLVQSEAKKAVKESRNDIFDEVEANLDLLFGSDTESVLEDVNHNTTPELVDGPISPKIEHMMTETQFQHTESQQSNTLETVQSEETVQSKGSWKSRLLKFIRTAVYIVSCLRIKRQVTQ